MNSRPRQSVFVLCALLLTAISPAFVAANGEVTIVEIQAYWIDSEETGHDHAWKFTFDSDVDNYRNTASMNIVHVSGDTVILDATVNASELENVSGDANSLIWRPTSELQFGDQITIKVHNNGAIVTTREVGVTVWNQPLADHEVTIATNWMIDQEYDDENGTQSYQLEFVGQGWQQRIGDTLVANELGNGSLYIVENTENGTMNLNIDLSSIWRNETTIDGILDLQEFEATGTGVMYLINDDEGAIMHLNATVSDALFNRTYAGGSHTEHIRLQALGEMNVTEEDGDGNGTEISGDLSLLMVETIDVDGVRTFSLTHLEATAEMHMIDGDQRMDLHVDQLISVERWLDGELIEENNKIIAHGTFGFADEEDNGSVTINGTVLEFRSESVDGMTVQDKLHVDGTLEGEASGTFGIMRDIKETGTWHNINDTDYDVNVIHQESWFNVTAVQGWTNGGDGVGAQHNETWMYTVPQTSWDNRTIYQRWRSSGITDNDEGEEYLENSPIERDPEAPTAEEGLGDANISRETGLAPLSLTPGDQFILDAQSGIKLLVNATSTSTVDKDGHTLPVTLWSGVYFETESGIANGAIVNEGILNGLIAEVVRQTEVESPAGHMVLFNETQTLERVLSPSIVTAAENNHPSIISTSVRTGLLVNEGGSVGHLEVEVEDIDWNVETVSANLESLGMGTVELNDLGLDGDSGVHDDVWTAELSYMGILHGEVSINVTVSDAFDATDTEEFNITIFNQAPRLTSFEFVPIQVVRGDMIIINAQVFDGNGVESVSIDMRDGGGDLTDLTYDSITQKWVGQVSIPSGMSPGNHQLRIMMTDSDGASITVTEMQTQGIHRSSGQETHPDDVITPLVVMNEGPIISSPIADKSPITRPDLGGEQVTITVFVSDPDDVTTVVVKLAELSPPGMQDTWLFMNDDGQQGDETANDGIWTYVFESRSGMPLGTFAVTVRATDTYGAWSEDDSLAIQVIEDDGLDPGGDPGSVFSSTAVVMGLVSVLLIAAVGLVVVIVRRTREEGGMKWDESDAFGGG